MRKLIWGFVLLVFGLVGSAKAHFLWLNPWAYHLDTGEDLRLTLGFGHNFPGPGGDFLEASYLKTLFLWGPEGTRVDLKTGKYPILFKSPSVLEKEGTYLLVAAKKPGFFSKTATGFARKPKNELSDVIECKYSKRYAKALITVGKPGGKAYQKVIGHELEIIPLKDPYLLRVGDGLPVKVLYQGRPLAKTWVLATYEGFSPTGHQTYFSFAARTNRRGETVIRLDHRGVWLIFVSHQEPYPQPDVCDVSTAVATLTFELR